MNKKLLFFILFILVWGFGTLFQLLMNKIYKPTFEQLLKSAFLSLIPIASVLLVTYFVNKKKLLKNDKH